MHPTFESLNPSSNGVWSLTANKKNVSYAKNGLNPSSNGVWSLTLGDC